MRASTSPRSGPCTASWPRAGRPASDANQLTHPRHARPELLATQPNQLWSWDITKLLGPATWTYYYLYVILDVFSRYVVGWTVAHAEQAALAERLLAETTAKQQITPGTLTVHADRGPSMTSKPVAFLLADLGVTKTQWHQPPCPLDIGGRRSQAPMGAGHQRPAHQRRRLGGLEGRLPLEQPVKQLQHRRVMAGVRPEAAPHVGDPFPPGPLGERTFRLGEERHGLRDAVQPPEQVERARTG
jgi:Integrase core domain